MVDDIWTVKRILEWIEGYLEKHGDENPRLSAQWLVSDALDCSRMQLFLDMERPLTPHERDVLRDYTKRRAQGEPLQYIVGKTAFRHIDVRVRQGVLIPRPETEVLVSEALALLPAPGKPQDILDAELIRRFEQLKRQADSDAEEQVATNRAASDDANNNGDGRTSQSHESPVDTKPDSPSHETLLVADICTGSGCIACSIAHEHEHTHVIATDLSDEAVSLARENVEALGLSERVEVIACDLATGIDDSLLGSFDLVVSNPPYVPTGVLSSIPHEVSAYEPMLALDGGEDGLALFRRLMIWSTKALRPGGAFACELHETCLDQAAEEAARTGFVDVRIVADLAGRPRVLTARTPRL